MLNSTFSYMFKYKCACYYISNDQLSSDLQFMYCDGQHFEKRCTGGFQSPDKVLYFLYLKQGCLLLDLLNTGLSVLKNKMVS
jgi:hypothetical protein